MVTITAKSAGRTEAQSEQDQNGEHIAKLIEIIIAYRIHITTEKFEHTAVNK